MNKGKSSVLAFVLASLLLLSFNFLIAESSTSVTNTQFTNPSNTFTGTTPGFTGITSSFGGSYENLMSGVQGIGLGVGSDGEELFDMEVMIPPAGCKPYVVRSDLLEEQNVPVFCELVALKINPGVDISKINRISFNQKESNKYISGVGFHPANAAIRSTSSLTSTPLNGVLGYVVVVLKKTPAEKDMPDNITTTLSAVLDYGLTNAFGIGQNEFYLPVMDDSEFSNNYKDYSFMNGLGYLRVEDMDDNSATISIYTSDQRRVWSSRIENGKTSKDFYINSFTGGQGLRVVLKDIALPQVKARLRVNGNIYDVYQGGRFADGKCVLSNVISNGGGTGTVVARCGSKVFNLEKKFNQVRLAFSGLDSTNGLKSVGDKIEVYEGANLKTYYLVYLENTFSEDQSKSQPFIILYHSDNFAPVADNIILNERKNIAKTFTNAANNKVNFEEAIKKYSTVNYLILNQGQTNNGITFSSTEVFDKAFNNTQAEDYYKSALSSYEEVINKFASESNVFPLSKATNQSFGADTLWAEYNLATELNQLWSSQILLSRIENDYPQSRNLFDGKDKNKGYESLKQSQLYSNEGSSDYSSKDDLYMELISVKEPSENEAGVQIVYSENNKNTPMVVNKGDFVVQNNNLNVRLVDFTEDEACFSYECKETAVDGKKYSETRKCIGITTPLFVQGCGASIKVNKITRKQVAHVQLIPIVNGRSRETNFTFSIGVEKRALAMNLTPEEANAKMTELNSQIAKWRNITDNLGELIKAGKATCLATTALLNLKNLVSGYSGEATARNAAMTGQGGWNDICAKDGDFEGCLSKYESQIDTTISKEQQYMEEYNNLEKSTRESFGKDVKQEQVKAKIIEKIDKDSLQLLDESGQDISAEQKSKVIAALKPDYIGTAELSQLYVDAKLTQDSGVPEVYSKQKKIAVYSKLKQLSEKYEDDITRSSELSKVGLGDLNVQSLSSRVTTGNLYYTGDKWDNIKAKFTESSRNSIAGNPKVVLAYDNAKNYMYVVESTGGVMQINDIYWIDSSKNLVKVYSNTDKVSITLPTAITDSDVRRLRDVKITELDENSFKNRCNNCDYMKVFSLEPYKGMPALLPFDNVEGWYVKVENNMPFGGNIKSYQDSGALSSFYICNVGKDGIMEERLGADKCMQFNMNTGQSADQTSFGLSAENSKRLVSDAVNAVKQAQRELTRNADKITITARRTMTLKVQATSSIDGSKCTDFMSQKDCQIMFNVCDPFVCPSSRCDFGGQYPVDDVIQSGIVGSTLLCIKNFIGFPNGDVIIPVCITGINAGIDAWATILESYRDCINESVTSGKTVGICDEIQSVYVCDFMWKQIGPYVSTLAKNIFSGSIFNQKYKGGGEYAFGNDAWANAEKSWQFFQTDYASSSKLAFGARSLSEVGSEFCKMKASATYPNQWDAVLEPESPVQLHAWFDEMAYTDATIPPKSQYKVFYHIYAGKDQGAYYSVYLKSPTGTLGYTTKETSTVASGYIQKGGKITETKDFLDNSGFKEMCVRVNMKDYCGFKQVSTSAALNYAKEELVSQEATESNIKSSKDCVQGTPSAASLITPNIQQAGEEIVSPELYNYGIIRVCASDNPGRGVDETRWAEVGYCDDTSIKCWIDGDSVSDALTIKGIENKTLQELNLIAQAAAKNNIAQAVYDPENVKVLVGALYGKYSPLAKNKKATELEKVEEDFQALYDRLIFNKDKAYLMFVKSLIYDEAARAFRDAVAGKDNSYSSNTGSSSSGQDNVNTAIGIFNAGDQIMFAKMLQGEESTAGNEAMTAAGWIALNRLNKNSNEFGGDTLKGVLEKENQFIGYLGFDTKGETISQGSIDLARTLLKAYPNTPIAYKDYLYFVNVKVADTSALLGLNTKFKECGLISGTDYKRVGSTTMFISKEYCKAAHDFARSTF